MASSSIKKGIGFVFCPRSATTIAVNETYQIPSEAMSCNFILIEMFRSNRCGTLLITKDGISNVRYSSSTSINISSTHGYQFTISTTGVF